jgi:hypothetical protein
MSSMMSITEGVPQGSILGLYDVPLYVYSKVDTFADDTTLLTSPDFRNVHEPSDTLSTTVTQVYNWARANKLHLNSSKTKTMLITGKRLKAKLSENDRCLCVAANDVKLDQTNHTKLLGLELDDELNRLTTTSISCVPKF